jgi:hypothetical protein
MTPVREFAFLLLGPASPVPSTYRIAAKPRWRRAHVAMPGRRPSSGWQFAAAYFAVDLSILAGGSGCGSSQFPVGLSHGAGGSGWGFNQFPVDFSEGTGGSGCGFNQFGTSTGIARDFDTHHASGRAA